MNTQHRASVQAGSLHLFLQPHIPNSVQAHSAKSKFELETITIKARIWFLLNKYYASTWPCSGDPSQALQLALTVTACPTHSGQHSH